jgi:hypothetical protein
MLMSIKETSTYPPDEKPKFQTLCAGIDYLYSDLASK